MFSGKLTDFINWLNPLFTTAVITVDLDVSLKVAAFLFVTVPLGIVQWMNLRDRLKERRNKPNAPQEPDRS